MYRVQPLPSEDLEINKKTTAIVMQQIANTPLQ
jgi:hypothetical protein